MTSRPQHVDEVALTAWMDGALDDASTATVEAHVMACPECAARLESLARVEAAMFEAAEVLHPVAVAAPRRRKVWAGQSLALAAALVLGLGLPGRWLSFAHDGDTRASETIEASLDASLLRSAPPSCPVLDDPSAELCDGPATFDEVASLDGALAMTMPDITDDAPAWCEDDGGSSLVCDVGESVAG